jgi:predicted dehydrogenase
MTKKYIDKESIGAPVHICATNYVPYGAGYWGSEYRNFEITQGLFLQKATHDLDYISYLMGEPITRVAAMGTYGLVFGGDKPESLNCADCDEARNCLESPENRKRNTSGGKLEDHPCVFSKACGTKESGTNEDASSVLMEFASGAHGVYTQVFFSRRDAARRGAVVSGYMGTLDFDWYRNDLKYTRHHAPFSDTIKAGEGLSHFGGDMELAHDFIDIINGNGESRTDIQTGIQSVYACLAAKESAERGVFVEVRKVGGSGK